MGEYTGRINVPKDTMLHVVNGIFNRNIPEITSKENILKLIPEIYTEENFEEIIKMIPYESYVILEKLLEFVKHNDDINELEKQIEHAGIYYLQEAMIIVLRAKYSKYDYSLNPGVIENLKPLFNEPNRKLAERYGKIEQLTKGLLYTYGVVELDYLRTTICKFMKEIITEDELYDFYFKRLNLNTFVNYVDIRWMNNNETQKFATYLNEEEISVDDIATEQKSRGLQYKSFSEGEILKRDVYLWDERLKRLYEFIKKRNDDMWELKFERIVKKNELGENILGELTNMCMFENEFEMVQFMNLFMEWYNNSSQYVLGGFSPNELVMKMKR